MPESHRKRLKRIHEPGHLHELTFSCYKRKSLLTNDTWRIQLSRFIEQACEKSGVGLIAFVYMPNHIHMLVHPTDRDAKMGPFLARFKRPFSSYVKKILIDNEQGSLLDQLTVRERPGKTCFRFWQEGGGYDRNLFELEAIEASINYIHLNPVKKDYCQKAVEWKWSSARWIQNQGADPDLPHLTKLPVDLFHHERKRARRSCV